MPFPHFFFRFLFFLRLLFLLPLFTPAIEEDSHHDEHHENDQSHHQHACVPIPGFFRDGSPGTVVVIITGFVIIIFFIIIVIVINGSRPGNSDVEFHINRLFQVCKTNPDRVVSGNIGNPLHNTLFRQSEIIGTKQEEEYDFVAILIAA